MATKLRPTGTIMFDVEKVVLSLVYARGYSWAKILHSTALILSQYHPDAQEEYVSGGHPRLQLTPLVKVSRHSPRLRRVIHELCVKHDMQWYEVLSLVEGYLKVHCPEGKDKGFRFYYGA